MKQGEARMSASVADIVEETSSNFEAIVQAGVGEANAIGRTTRKGVLPCSAVTSPTNAGREGTRTLARRSSTNEGGMLSIVGAGALSMAEGIASVELAGGAEIATAAEPKALKPGSMHKRSSQGKAGQG
jgi:hypothetical protein